MRDDNLTNLGRDIGRAVRNVLNSRDFEDLKQSIDSAVHNIGKPPFGPPPPYQQDSRYNPYGPQGPGPGGFYQGPGAGQGQAPGGSQQGAPGTRQNGGQRAYNQNWNWQQPPRRAPRQRDARRTPPPYRPPVMNRQMTPYRVKNRGELGTLFMVLGTVLTGLFGFVTLWCLYTGMMANLLPLIILLPLLAASCSLLGLGERMRNKVKRYRGYMRVLGERTYCSIKELADGMGLSAAYVAKDLEKMIGEKMFPQGHLDEQKTCLMTDEATYAQYVKTQEHLKKRQEEERRAQELREKDPQAAALQEMIAEGERYREEIRRANDAIPGEIISLKLDRLEKVTTKIFEYVEAHPKKLPDIRKFLSYYLPITLKLVGAYRDFDSQPVQGDNILSAKKEIEETLDTINQAFENLLDSLFEDDALDISTDISALETMLAQEGLTGQKFGSQPGEGR